jgi:hypothetical protein
MFKNTAQYNDGENRKEMIEDQQQLYPVASKMRDGGLHLIVQLFEQIRQVIAFAASRAAPIDLLSRAQHLQWTLAQRADERGVGVLAVEHGSVLLSHWPDMY